MDSYWQGFVTTTYGIIDENVDLFVWIFAVFLTMLILRGIVGGFTSIGKGLKG